MFSLCCAIILYSYYSHLKMTVLEFRASVKDVRLSPSCQSGEFNVAFCHSLFINIISAICINLDLSPQSGPNSRILPSQVHTWFSIQMISTIWPSWWSKKTLRTSTTEHNFNVGSLISPVWALLQTRPTTYQRITILWWRNATVRLTSISLSPSALTWKFYSVTIWVIRHQHPLIFRHLPVALFHVFVLNRRNTAPRTPLHLNNNTCYQISQHVH